MLRMLGIGKDFGTNRVLDGVDFELSAGEVHVLAGENGAGKSTLVKVLGGVHRDYRGEIEILGKRVRFSCPHEASANGIAVIHQEMSLVGAMSVADNIFLGREKAGVAGWIRKGAQLAGAETLLKQFGIPVDVRLPVEDYPISTRQMIEIAKALACDARIIVMDEPTSALTEPEAERLFGIIEGLRRRGCAVVYISHKMQEIYRVADRITVLRDGRLVGTSAASGLPQEEMIRWMVGRDLNGQFVKRDSRPGNVRLKVDGFTIPGRAGGFPVLGVSLSVRQGEVLGIAGLQGAGNSELLNGLFGAYGPPKAGRVEIDGAVVRVGSPRFAIRNGMALLTNDRKATGLVMQMSVFRNVTLASLPAFSPLGWLMPSRERAASRRRGEELHIKMHSVDQETWELSGGNQQKVVLARWLEAKPRILLLDEPTRGVDIAAKHEIYELINRCCGEGMAVVLITSEMPELLAMSDRILVMHRGRVAAEFDRAQASQEGILAAAMGGT
jgi:ABC-type sugar transport system ATPase subunit